jgi:hypothetical protein
MRSILLFLAGLFATAFRSRLSLQLDVVALRHLLSITQGTGHGSHGRLGPVGLPDLDPKLDMFAVGGGAFSGFFVPCCCGKMPRR